MLAKDTIYKVQFQEFCFMPHPNVGPKEKSRTVATKNTWESQGPILCDNFRIGCLELLL